MIFRKIICLLVTFCLSVLLVQTPIVAYLYLGLSHLPLRSFQHTIYIQYLHVLHFSENEDFPPILFSQPLHIFVPTVYRVLCFLSSSHPSSISSDFFLAQSAFWKCLSLCWGHVAALRNNIIHNGYEKPAEQCGFIRCVYVALFINVDKSTITVHSTAIYRCTVDAPGSLHQLIPNLSMVLHEDCDFVVIRTSVILEKIWFLAYPETFYTTGEMLYTFLPMTNSVFCTRRTAGKAPPLPASSSLALGQNPGFRAAGQNPVCRKQWRWWGCDWSLQI